MRDAKRRDSALNGPDSPTLRASAPAESEVPRSAAAAVYCSEAAVTIAGSQIIARPQRNATMFCATATPFSSMADSTLAGVIGNAPAWTAMPTTKTFALTAEPQSAVTSEATSAQCRLPSTVAAATRSSRSWVAGMSMLGSATMAPVGVGDVEPTTIVRLGLATSRPAADAATSRSKATMTSAWPLPRRAVAGPPIRLSRRSPTTVPAFCDSPIWSRPRTSKPSNIAAVPSTWFTVTTPVPPIPHMRTDTSSGPTSGTGSGSSSGGSGRVSPPEPSLAAEARTRRIGASISRTAVRNGPGSLTVMNDGQSPSRHE